jgi:hypothetical protein
VHLLVELRMVEMHSTGVKIIQIQVFACNFKKKKYFKHCQLSA